MSILSKRSTTSSSRSSSKSPISASKTAKEFLNNKDIFRPISNNETDLEIYDEDVDHEIDMSSCDEFDYLIQTNQRSFNSTPTLDLWSLPKKVTRESNDANELTFEDTIVIDYQGIDGTVKIKIKRF